MTILVERIYNESEVLVDTDGYQIRQLSLSIEQLKLLWEMLCRHKTLFSDLTRGDFSQFVLCLSNHNSVWYEVVEHDTMIGVIYFDQMYQVVDCTGHMVFFDRQPAAKLRLCKDMVRWMFQEFPLHRMTVMPPEIYHATIRLLERIGLKYEGTKRESALIGGRWIGQRIYGITRHEVEMML